MLKNSASFNVWSPCRNVPDGWGLQAKVPCGGPGEAFRSYPYLRTKISILRHHFFFSEFLFIILLSFFYRLWVFLGAEPSGFTQNKLPSSWNTKPQKSLKIVQHLSLLYLRKGHLSAKGKGDTKRFLACSKTWKSWWPGLMAGRSE